MVGKHTGRKLVPSGEADWEVKQEALYRVIIILRKSQELKRVVNLVLVC